MYKRQTIPPVLTGTRLLKHPHLKVLAVKTVNLAGAKKMDQRFGGLNPAQGFRLHLDEFQLSEFQELAHRVLLSAVVILF